MNSSINCSLWKVDLKCIQEGTGCCYYDSHLPILGKEEGGEKPISTKITQTVTVKKQGKETSKQKPRIGLDSNNQARSQRGIEGNHVKDNKEFVTGDILCVSLALDIVKDMNSTIGVWKENVSKVCIYLRSGVCKH